MKLTFSESSFNFLQNRVVFCTLYPLGYTVEGFAPYNSWCRCQRLQGPAAAPTASGLRGPKSQDVQKLRYYSSVILINLVNSILYRKKAKLFEFCGTSYYRELFTWSKKKNFSHTFLYSLHKKCTRKTKHYLLPFIIVQPCSES